MKKFKFLFFLPLLFCTSLQATELYTTAVQKGLSDMLNPSGKFTTLKFSDGTTQTTASGGAASVAFSEVTGSASATQLPLVSGLLGSATSAQLPTVTRLYGTTTEQAAGEFGQLYVQSSSAVAVPYGTITGGNADASAWSGAYIPANAFDNNITTFWDTQAVPPQWISYDTGTTSTNKLNSVNIYPYLNRFKGFRIQGSNDNSNYYTIYTGTSTASEGWTNYPAGTITPYRWFRVYVDSVYSSNVVLYEVALQVGEDMYTQYSAKYADSVNGNTVFEIFTPGTATTKASYIYCNATTTVFSSGTNTAITGTVTLYSGYTPAGKGAWYCDGYNTSSESKTKTGIYLDPYKEMQKYCYNALLQGNVVEWQRLDETKEKYSLEDVENQTKERYKSNLYTTWEGKNKTSYTSTIFDDGGSSTTTIDSVKMKSDFNDYSEVEWAGEIDQAKLVKEAERELMGNGVDRIGYIADAPETPSLFKLPDGSGLSLDNQIGGLQLGFREIVERLDKATAELGSVTAEIARLKAKVNP